MKASETFQVVPVADMDRKLACMAGLPCVYILIASQRV